MFKFLRKYNKYILAVGGTLLLITFLIPFAFTNLLQGVGAGRASWASVGTEKSQKVTVTELANIQRQLRLLQVLGPQVRLPNVVDRPEYWYLLVREAHDAGLVPAAEAVGQTEQEIQQMGLLAAITGESVPFIRATIANIQGVERLMDLYLDSGKYSDRRLKEQARRMFHRVTAQPVVIEASSPAEPPAYTERQLLDQMEQYADVAPGEGEMGFGYRLPHRAKLEWIDIPAESVRAMIASSDRVNPIELRKHWRSNAVMFGDPDPAAEIPDTVREDLVDKLTAAALDEIAREASDRLRFAQRSLNRRGGYFEVPDGWAGLSLKDLALELQSEHGIALPAYHGLGDRWLTAEDIGELPGIGTATTSKFGETPIVLADLVMAARELEGSTTILAQRGIPGPALRGDDGSIYLFNIIDTDASRPPESIDEVRDKVVADLNRLTHYRQLVEAGDDIRTLAADEGLLSAALRYNSEIASPVSVSLGFPAQLPKLGQQDETIEKLVDYAMALPRDVPVKELSEEQRILVIPVQDKLSLLVARLTGQTPLTEETFRSYMQFGIVQSKLVDQELAGEDLTAGPFSYEALAARHHFELTAGDRATTQPDATDPDTQELSALGDQG